MVTRTIALVPKRTTSCLLSPICIEALLVQVLDLDLGRDLGRDLDRSPALRLDYQLKDVVTVRQDGSCIE